MQHVSSLTFPVDQPPPLGTVTEIAPGVLWFRLPLPFALNHVNIYLIEDDGGWRVLDSGLGSDDCKAGWQTILKGPLAGQRLTSLIVTHFHPDHVGLAGWMAERFGLTLAMPRTEYLFHQVLRHAHLESDNPVNRAFYQSNGLSSEATEQVLRRGHRYLHMTSGVPVPYQRIAAGDVLSIGGRDFDVLTGGGHSLEQAMLHRPADRLFLAADQVIARISPNVSVHPLEPDQNVLGAYLRSLTELRATVADDVLVLPGHVLPFHGLHTRIDDLLAHHEERCGMIATACAVHPLTVADMIPHIFHRPLDEHQTGFAFGEVLAHVNLMLRRGQLERLEDNHVDLYRSV